MRVRCCSDDLWHDNMPFLDADNRRISQEELLERTSKILKPLGISEEDLSRLLDEHVQKIGLPDVGDE